VLTVNLKTSEALGCRCYLVRHVTSRCPLWGAKRRWQDFQRNQSRRPAGRTADDLSSGDQPQDSDSNRSRRAAHFAVPRRRGDRM